MSELRGIVRVFEQLVKSVAPTDPDPGRRCFSSRTNT